MPVLVVGPELDFIPGSPGASTQVLGNARPRIIVHNYLTLDSLWARAASPRNADIALTLVFDPTLARVRITATGVYTPGIVTIERSTNAIQWTTVRGGTAITVPGSGTVTLDDYEFTPNVLNYYRLRVLAPVGQTEIAPITPTLTSIWLKSVPRPFLNLAVSLLGDKFAIDRSDRGGVFDVVGRSLPVAVTDVRGSRRFDITIRTDTDQAASNLDLLIASGDVLMLQAPPGMVVPAGSMFVVASQPRMEHAAPGVMDMRRTTVTLIEVAAPGPDVIGTTATWQTVLNTYATWADVLAANATWADLLNLVGNPSEVVVP